MTSPPPAEHLLPPPVVPLPASHWRLSVRSLPRPLSSLIGREREIDEVGELLGLAEVRLLTLTGPGGVGKTRLALRVGEAIAGAFADGVAFIALAQVREPELVLPAIAQALGIREAGGHGLADLLPAALADRRLLLVLDNLEHVLDAAPRLFELLLDCPTLKILATSRELLRVSGEHGFPVPPLAVAAPTGPAGPTEDAARPPDAFASSPAVRLFVERAQALRPDFALDGANVAIVAEICRRVDGLPLGIELAAARMRHLSVDSLLIQLDRRLPTLTDGPHDAPARLRTMRDAIAWSYDLLSPAEQAICRRLAVFVGGFTLAAAEHVASRGVEQSRSREEDTLAPRLLDLPTPRVRSTWSPRWSTRTCCASTRPPVEDTRYHMLETVREFGIEQLTASAEDASIRQRHATWCLAFAQSGDGSPSEAERPDQGRRLQREEPNLRAALAWFLEQGEAASLVRLTLALYPYWEERCLLTEGRRWLEQAIRLGAGTPVGDRLALLSGAGTLAWRQSDFAQAVAWHEQALALARAAGDLDAEAFARNNLGVQALDQGDYETATAHFEASLAISRSAELPRRTCLALHNLGYLAWLRDGAGTAAGQLAESLALARRLEDSALVAIGLLTLGHVLIDLGRCNRATVAFGEALDLAAADASPASLIDVLEGLARVGVALGQLEQAPRLVGAAALLRERYNVPLSPMDRVQVEPMMNALRDRLGADSLAAGLVAGRTLPLEGAIAEAHRYRAVLMARSSAAPDRRTVHAHGMTERELEILGLLVAGNSNRAISNRLFISPATVKRHLANLYAKLGVDSRAKAVAFARRHDLA